MDLTINSDATQETCPCGFEVNNLATYSHPEGRAARYLSPRARCDNMSQTLSGHFAENNSYIKT